MIQSHQTYARKHGSGSSSNGSRSGARTPIENDPANALPLAIQTPRSGDSPRSLQGQTKGRKKSKSARAASRMRGLDDLEAPSVEDMQLEDIGPEDEVDNLETPINQDALPLHMQLAAIADGDMESEVSKSETQVSKSDKESETNRNSARKSSITSATSIESGASELYQAEGSAASFGERGKGRRFQEFAMSDHRGGRRFAFRQSDQPQVEEKRPMVRVYARLIWNVLCFVWVWSSLGAVLLVLYACQYYFFAVVHRQKIEVQAALDAIEAAFMSSVEPPKQVMRVLSSAARAGVLNTINNHSILEELLAPEFWIAPALREIILTSSVEGSMVTLIQPGNVVVEESSIFDEMAPLIRSLAAEKASQHTGVPQLHLPPSSSAGFWEGPRYLREDRSGQPLDPEDWRLALELLWTVSDNTRTVNFHIRAAFDLDVAQKALNTIKEATGEGSAMYICTKEGTLISGSDWQPRATVDGKTGELKYQSLWNLPMVWVHELPPEALTAGGGAELLTGQSTSEKVFVVVRPFSWGAQSSAEGLSNGYNFRAIAAVPRAGSLIEMFTPGTLAFAAFVWLSWLVVVLGLQVYRHRRIQKALTEIGVQNELHAFETEQDVDQDHRWGPQGRRGAVNKGLKSSLPPSLGGSQESAESTMPKAIRHAHLMQKLENKKKGSSGIS